MIIYGGSIDRYRVKGKLLFYRSHYEDVLLVRVHEVVPEEKLAQTL